MHSVAVSGHSAQLFSMDIEDNEEPDRIPASRGELPVQQQTRAELLGSHRKLEAQADDLARMLATMRAVFEATSDAILITDDMGRIVDFNRRYAALWCASGETLSGSHYCTVMAGMRDKLVGAETCLKRFAEIVDSELPRTLDLMTFQDGRILEYSTRIQTIEDRHVGRVWSFRDVTASVRAEQALRYLNATLERRVIERSEQLLRSEQQFDQLVAGIQDCAIYMLDPQGYLVSWNRGAQHIKGYRADEVIGSHYSLFFTDEDRRKGFPQRALELARANGKYESEAWRIRKDGTRFWASALINAMFDPTGRLTGFAKITRDMTERRALQEQLHQSQKMEAIGQMTGGIAHDFNNLLTVIVGNLDRLATNLPRDNPRLHHAVEQAMRGAQRAATLTQQLLAFARRQPLNPKPTNVGRLITETTELIRRTLPENIVLNTILDPELKTVEVDAHQLESALLNLAVNARDAMPRGGKLTIEALNVQVVSDQFGRFADIAAGQYVSIGVSDNGIGMNEEVLARAFDPFFTTKPIGTGTGLGLSQVYGFVKQSGGHINLYSDVGQGTAVRIYLPPLAQETVDVETDEQPVIPQAHSNETILVVEDDADVRAYTTETLHDLGFTVLTADNATSALHLLETHANVHLLFTDVGLPGLNGKELADEAQRRNAKLRVLFTSGYARSAIAHTGRLDAGVALLNKPFTRGQLAARIREMLDAEQVVAHY